MRIIKWPLAALTLLVAGALSAAADDLASIRKALEAKYTLTVTTADKTDIVTAGSILVLKKSNLMTVDVTSKNLYGNTYKNGRITQNALGKTSGWLKRLPGASAAGGSDRVFVTGEKVWLTAIDVTEKGVVFNLYTDAFGDTRYEAALTFPFEKGATPTVNGVTAEIEEVFGIQAADDGKGQQSAAPAQRGPAPLPAPPAPAAQPAEAPPPPITPPPPPPADPKTIALGQTIDQVTANFGQPTKILKLGAKQIYVYSDMKVTFVSGKVTDVQ
jgi:hypothetical protein